MATAVIGGPLRFATVGPWFAQAAQLSAAGAIDLSAVTQCDSAGVALLLDIKRRAERGGHSLRFDNAPQQLRGLLSFFGLERMLGITTT